MDDNSVSLSGCPLSRSGQDAAHLSEEVRLEATLLHWRDAEGPEPLELRHVLRSVKGRGRGDRKGGAGSACVRAMDESCWSSERTGLTLASATNIVSSLVDVWMRL